MKLNIKNKQVEGKLWWTAGLLAAVIGTSPGLVLASDEKAPSKPVPAPAAQTAPQVAPSGQVSPAAPAAAAGKQGALSTPSALTKRVIGLLGRPDAEQLRKMTYAVGPEESRFKEAVIKLFVACGRLHEASVARFGPAGDLSPVNGTDDASIERLQLEEQIVGEEALVHLSSDHNPSVYYFNRVDGVWMLRVYKTYRSTFDSSQLPGNPTEKMEAVVKALEETLQKVNSNKYSTVQEAREGLKAAMGF